jgi:hypothetical protein
MEMMPDVLQYQAPSGGGKTEERCDLPEVCFWQNFNLAVAHSESGAVIMLVSMETCKIHAGISHPLS